MKRTFATGAIFSALALAFSVFVSPITARAEAEELRAIPENTETIYVNGQDNDVSEDILEALSDPSVTGVLVIDNNLVAPRYAEPDSGTMAARAGYTLKNRRYNGVLTGSTRLATATGRPGITLTISETKSVSNSYDCSVSVPVSLINACVGFNTTASEAITVSGSAVVPEKVGAREVSTMTLIANPTYDYYSYDVYQGSTFIDRGFAKHAVGVYFWKSYVYK